MKFDNHIYWKHKRCMDVFIQADSCYDNGIETEINGMWLIQGSEYYWYASEPELIRVKMCEYENWSSYQPRGELLMSVSQMLQPSRLKELDTE